MNPMTLFVVQDGNRGGARPRDAIMKGETIWHWENISIETTAGTVAKEPIL